MVVLAKAGNNDSENGNISSPPEQNKKLRYPVPVFFIVVTEFCERFAYYGMRAVLTIYMRSILNFSDDLATTIYHVFLFLCYGLPIFGAILADSFVGKYTTVFALSTIFAAGNILLTAASTPPLHLPTVAFSLTGLALMAIGTGGIKPCVVALGGDQFILPHQERQLKQFFSIFVFAVSVGNMLSTVITPVLRSDVQCFNQDCYPLAFGIPAVLMVVAIGIFMAGKPMYKINQPKDNIILRVSQCIIHALSQRRIQKTKHSLEPSNKEHWVDYAHYDGSKFDKQLIQDTKGLLRVLVYYLPVPMFWALYEQLGSRWTLQATRMDGRMGKYTIKPDQMQVANAILMFMFIPIFETVVYPLLRKCNIFKRPLQRMSVGGLLAALSFLIAGVVELRIERSFLPQPTLAETHLNIINTLPCHLTVLAEQQHSTGVEFNGGLLTVEPGSNIILHSITERNVTLSFAPVFNDTLNCFPNSPSTLDPLNAPLNMNLSWSGTFATIPGVVQSIIVTINPSTGRLDHYTLTKPEDIGKSRQGFSKLRVVNLDGLLRKGTGNQTQSQDGFRILNQSKDRSYTLMADSNHGFSSSLEIPPDMYVIIPLEDSFRHSDQFNGSHFPQYLNLEVGGNYMVVLTHDREGQLMEQIMTVVPPNEVNMLWLLPQYLVMAWAEILFIISGMEFSFTEAPTSMKSVLQSCWHLTNAMGNLLVIIAAQNKGQKTQATEFLIFASLMLINTVIFAVMASRYKYVSARDDDVGKESTHNSTLEAKGSKAHNSITPTNSNDAQDTRL
ncbi:unnamed protein product [Allacma fusca]|uniref:Oligopeptide transporter 1 n=1 Tax=Allacma fusca TaxID=39272 RepID=A0A8J2P9D3_9HEXA|nr:unnamed protein product [Allacma fusca]